MNGAQAPFIKLFICLHVIDFRGGNSMTCPRKRNRSRLSLSDSIEMIRLRESQKEKQRRHEDDSVVFGVCGRCRIVYFDPRRPHFAVYDNLKLSC